MEFTEEELNDLFECVCAGGAGGFTAYAPQNIVTNRLYDNPDEQEEQDNKEDEE